MTNRSFIQTTLVGAALCVSAFTVSVMPAHAANHESVKAQADREDLREIADLAEETSSHADSLKSMIATNEFSPASHQYQLATIADDINRMGKEVARMEKAKSSLPGWEQSAVDQVLPLLRRAAMDTTKATKIFEENQSHLWVPENSVVVTRIGEETSQIASIASKAVKLEHLREMEARLSATGSTTK